MNKMIVLSACCAMASLGALNAAEPMATAEVSVDLDTVLGPVKPMHAVNNGPSVTKPGGDQKCGNFDTYRAARIPFARTHDSSYSSSYGGPHIVDIDVLFPDFDADENDPKSYDFVCTDHYLDTIRRAGTEVFFRLGQKIEHGPKKYGVLPPKDYAKWARICEHVIRHYNEGWAWGWDDAYTTVNVAWSNQFNIVYWEIWNEPDLDVSDVGLPKNPRCWGGTVTNFFEFYETAATHLKGKFPHLKIGGPALCGREEWGARFLAYCRDHHVPLDFFSWHVYAVDPRRLSEKAVRIRKMMDDAGFGKAESILNEWNYVKGWGDDFVHSLEVESGRFNQKGAAFIAAAMVDCQSVPLDMLMFYDARIGCCMNNIFDATTCWPLKGYYPFYAWSKMVDRGVQVAAIVKEGRGVKSDAATGVVFPAETKEKTDGQFRAVAAKGEGGSLAVFVVRYAASNDVTDTGTVVLRIPGRSLTKARCHVTDAIRTHTEVPLIQQPDGSAMFSLMPDSFALIEVD